MKSPGSLFALLLTAFFLVAAAPAQALTVVVDAGHGGIDRGGAPGQRVAEKPYTLDVAQRLAATLRSNGMRVVLTRDGDYFVGLRQRCDIANAQRNAIFVSIHFNGAPRSGADGIETYYYTGQSASLAASVHRQVLAATGLEDRHVRRRGFFVIRRTSIPSILVELGFLSNPDTAQKVSGSPAYRQRLADAVARGILDRYQ
jgi:N-acetylmuramoyl-L-alanine amidase